MDSYLSSPWLDSDQAYSAKYQLKAHKEMAKIRDESSPWFALSSFCFAKLSKREALGITYHHLSP